MTVVPTVLEKQPENDAALNGVQMEYSQAECFTIGEITEKYGVSPSTVSNAIRCNSIPKKQVGKFVYVPQEAIDKIFANKKLLPLHC